MAPDSPSFFDRLSLSRKKSPILPLHSSVGRRPSNAYDLDELSPRPDGPLLPDSPQSPPALGSTMRSHSPADIWDDDPLSPAGSVSKLKPKALFAGPPPPIAASVLIQPATQAGNGSRELSREGRNARGNAPSRVTFGSFPSDHSSRDSRSARADSIWRNVQRRERALQKELQHLLDMQVEGLVSGGESLETSSAGGLDTWSDSGSSTPTGTFYSTATSKSRMMKSLDPPVRATARGDIIPIRQPKTSGPKGLLAARNGLRRSLAALTDVKDEENAYLETAISQRKKALTYLDKLDARRTGISAELHSLADDEEEPLAKELRGLTEQHESLGQEIRELEEKLIGMRNRHRWLDRKIEDVRNRREAGLSGYRGALKEVEGEVASLLRRPPIEPLDPDVADAVSRNEPTNTGGAKETSGGADFMRMIPARRTLSMARDWWEGEMGILQQRKAQVDKDREALEQGTALWQETAKLVTGFEKELRNSLSGVGSNAAKKGKQTPRAQQEAAESLLPRMGQVILELEENMRMAERNSWNLLICAIGAELEAFQEAERLLRGNIHRPESKPQSPSQSQSQPQIHAHADAGDAEEPWLNGDGQHEEPVAEKEVARETGYFSENLHDESDNEVPPDLLVSRLDEHDDGDGRQELGAEPLHASSLSSSRRRDSDNEVPPEFLAEHSNEGSID